MGGGIGGGVGGGAVQYRVPLQKGKLTRRSAEDKGV